MLIVIRSPDLEHPQIEISPVELTFKIVPVL